MLNARTLIRAALALVLFVSLPAAAALAQDKDMAEVEHYTLTMDKVNHFKGFLMDLQAYGKAHPAEMPEIKKALETDADKHEDLAGTVRRLNSNAAVASLLTKNGWTAHDYALFQVSFFQAMMASAMKPADVSDAKAAAQAHMNPANLAFIREHTQELTALMQSMKSDE